MDTPEFAYAIHITTTPERLWHALTDPGFSRRWWAITGMSDWQVGSIMSWEQEGMIIAGPAEAMLTSEPYHRLAYTIYTWHTYNPDLAHLLGYSDAFLATISREPRSRVAFTLEPLGQIVELTIVQDNFESPSTVGEMASSGWPYLLSSLKTLLEMGETPATSSDAGGQDRRIPPR